MPLITRGRETDRPPLLQYLAKIGLLHRSSPSLCGLWKSFYVDNHVGAVVRACNYHTHAPRHVREHLTTEPVQTIACSVILPRIDYCNSLLYSAPVAVVDKLQRVQNNVARVICQQRRCVSARPLLQSLHWLPVQQRIQYKIAIITHKASSTSVPRIHRRTPTAYAN